VDFGFVQQTAASCAFLKAFFMIQLRELQELFYSLQLNGVGIFYNSLSLLMTEH